MKFALVLSLSAVILFLISGCANTVSVGISNAKISSGHYVNSKITVLGQVFVWDLEEGTISKEGIIQGAETQLIPDSGQKFEETASGGFSLEFGNVADELIKNPIFQSKVESEFTNTVSVKLKNFKTDEFRWGAQVMNGKNASDWRQRVGSQYFDDRHKTRFILVHGLVRADSSEVKRDKIRNIKVKLPGSESINLDVNFPNNQNSIREGQATAALFEVSVLRLVPSTVKETEDNIPTGFEFKVDRKLQNEILSDLFRGKSKPVPYKR
ncbi:MAG: hypothetical protein AAF984_06155 [Verrucomicrobiota bacterium]